MAGTVQQPVVFVLHSAAAASEDSSSYTMHYDGKLTHLILQNIKCFVCLRDKE